MTKIDQITHESVHAAFLRAYRARVGQGPGRMGLGDLAAETDIEARTLRSWRETDSMPQLVNFLRLCAVLGPEFASQILHLVGLGGVEYIDRRPSNAPQCVADITGPLNELTHRLADGVFCHRDKAAMAPQLIELAATLEAQGRAMLGELPQ